MTPEPKPKAVPRLEAPASKPVEAVTAAQAQAVAPPAVTPDPKPKIEPRPEAPASKPVEAVAAAQAQLAATPTVTTEPQAESGTARGSACTQTGWRCRDCPGAGCGAACCDVGA